MHHVVLAQVLAESERPRALIPIADRAVLQTLGAQSSATACLVNVLDLENAKERVVVVTSGTLGRRIVLARTHTLTPTHTYERNKYYQ